MFPSLSPFLSETSKNTFKRKSWPFLMTQKPPLSHSAPRPSLRRSESTRQLARAPRGSPHSAAQRLPARGRSGRPFQAAEDANHGRCPGPCPSSAQNAWGCLVSSSSSALWWEGDRDTPALRGGPLSRKSNYIGCSAKPRVSAGDDSKVWPVDRPQKHEPGGAGCRARPPPTALLAEVLPACPALCPPQVPPVHPTGRCCLREPGSPAQTGGVRAQH